MSEGIKLLRKIQLGKETTAGTAVAATTLWRGMGTIDDTREIEFVEEDIGYLSGVDRQITPALSAAIDLETVPATFEQLPYLFECGIRSVTPAQDGSGSGYKYPYTAPTTTPATIKTYTIEGGDNIQAEEMEYSFAEEITLEGNAGEALMMSGTLIGRQATPVSFTGAISVPSVEDILFSKGKLYIGAVGTAFASLSQFTNTWLGMTMNIKTGWKAIRTADGALYWSFAKQVGPDITIDLKMEHNANSVAEKAYWRSMTARNIRMKWEGSAFTTAGTAYSVKTLIIDASGKWETFPALDDEDGDDIYTATFRSRYNSTAAFFFRPLIVNALSALP